MGLHSVSESATRELEPVLPSVRSVVPARALVSVCACQLAAKQRQDSHSGIPGAGANAARGAFQMLFPQGDECAGYALRWEESVPLSETPLE